MLATCQNGPMFYSLQSIARSQVAISSGQQSILPDSQNRAQHTAINCIDSSKGNEKCFELLPFINSPQTQRCIVENCACIFSSICEVRERISSIAETTETLKKTQNPWQTCEEPHKPVMGGVT